MLVYFHFITVHVCVSSWEMACFHNNDGFCPTSQQDVKLTSDKGSLIEEDVIKRHCTSSSEFALENSMYQLARMKEKVTSNERRVFKSLIEGKKKKENLGRLATGLEKIFQSQIQLPFVCFRKPFMNIHFLA